MYMLQYMELAPENAYMVPHGVLGLHLPSGAKQPTAG
jgi:hypothetical protein